MFLKIQESFWCNRPLRLVCLSNQDNNSVWAKKQLCTCNTLFSNFQWRPLHEYDVKPMQCNVLCIEDGENMTKKFFLSFFFSNLDKVLKNSTPKNNWQIERVQNDVMKFKRTQNHFYSDVFTAVDLLCLQQSINFNISKLVYSPFAHLP